MKTAKSEQWYEIYSIEVEEDGQKYEWTYGVTQSLYGARKYARELGSGVKVRRIPTPKTVIK